jgi:phage I-like protein
MVNVVLAEGEIPVANEEAVETGDRVSGIGPARGGGCRDSGVEARRAESTKTEGASGRGGEGEKNDAETRRRPPRRVNSDAARRGRASGRGGEGAEDGRDEAVEERVLIEASAVGEAVTAGRVLVAPWGTVESSNGNFIMDEEAARLTVEAFMAHGTDVPIDYEHQSLGGKYASPNGQAPAAGWIRGLRLVRPGDAEKERVGEGARGRGGEEDAATPATAGELRLGDAEKEGREEGEGERLEPGLYADVTWTEAARAKLAAREYRYLSPVVIVRKRDRRVVALHSAALTNKPAIVGMRPIVNKQEGEMREEETRREGDGVTPATAGKLRAGDAGSEADVLEAVEVLRLRLGLQESDDTQAVIVAAEQRIGELTEQVNRRDAEDRVAGAVRAGKLIPAQREWAMSLALRDPAGFDEWAASAPTVVTLGRTQPPTESGANHRRAAVIASARAAYRAEPGLVMLTSESAWVAETLRDAGIAAEE